ncbi:hypothetical protein [Tissierella praeacuta]|uniref:hypothetical protein n=1 Tax=Tissierella praeacuta TaxID=43131 RepID=UPI002FDA1212
MLNKNTVVIDLDRYDELVEDREFYRDKVNELENMLKNKVLLSIENFSINSKDNDGFELLIDIEGVKQIINSIGGYSLETKWSDQIKIGAYQMKLIKEEI